MMDHVRSYILSIITAAMVCSVIMKLTAGKGTQSAVVKMICALFLTSTVIGPFIGPGVGDIASVIPQLKADGSFAAAEGEKISRDAFRQGIKDRTEAYILDEAMALGAAVDVTVTVSDGDIPAPETVRIEGEISPYARTKLSTILETGLGIPKEAQTWI